jgi:putative inorganic carbon (HCO3(-)) transporter
MLWKSRWHKLLGGLADRQILFVGLLAPVFMLADRLPGVAVALAVLAILPLWLLHRLGRGRFFTPTPLDMPLLLLLATVPAGVWVAAMPALALPRVLQILYGVTLFYALVNSLTSAGKIEWAGRITLLGTALLAGLGLVGTDWGATTFLPAGLAQRIPHLLDGIWYSAGFNANIVAGALAILVPITAAYAWSARRRLPGLGLWLLFLIEAAILALTQSRGALLGLAAGLVVVAVGRDRRWAWAVGGLALVAVAGIVLYGLQPTLELVMAGGGDSAVNSMAGRLEIYSRGLYMLQDFPFTGIGLGMFPRVLPLLYPLFQAGPATGLDHVHNIYLQAGLDHGLPGLIAFLAIVMLLVAMAGQAIRRSRGQPWEPLAIGLLGGLAAYLVHGLVDMVWNTPRSNPILWACWGLLAAVWCWSRSTRQPAGDAEENGPAEP